MNFENAVSVITGAGSGIGRELALLLAKRKSNVVITDINPEGLKETEALLADAGVTVKSAILDVADKAAFEALASEVEAEMGPANAIFNNAGVALDGKVGEMQREHFEWIVNINFWGVVNGTEAFLPQLKRAEWGQVVNVSSLFGIIGIPGQSAYCATKFAVRGFTEALAFELRKSSVKAASVHPGGIQTNIVKNATKDWGEAERKKAIADFNKVAPTTAAEAAQIIVAGVDAGKRQIIVGKDAKLLSRISRLMPGTYEKVLAKIFKWK